MSLMGAAARWTAIAIAAAAVLDPSIPLPARARPGLRVIGESKDATAAVARKVSDAGFALHEPQDEVATVFVGDAPPDRGGGDAPPDRRGGDAPPDRRGTPIWALDLTPVAPNVRVAQAKASAVRFPGQAMDVAVGLDARGMAGKTTEVVLEDAGIRVASLRHEWKSDAERWQGSLHYLPPGAAAGRLRVRAVEVPGESSTHDNAAEVAVPPMRGGIRTLVVEAGVTWPALFVRRAIEGEPAFAVAALQKASTRIATRAGAPPAALTRGALESFEVALVGAPANLTAGDVEALRWFVEERGGIAVLIPDQPPTGRYLELLDAPQFEPRAVDSAVALSHGLMASEFVVSRSMPPGTEVLAGTAAGEPVVFSARRGAGAVIFSGALDAWRYRANQTSAFAQFWRRAILDAAASVPPVLEVTVNPSFVSLGATTLVRARLRATELPPTSDLRPPTSDLRPPAFAKATAGKPALELPLVAARAVSPGARVDVPVRLWPTAEPGVYEGEWRPSTPGDYDVAVGAGPHSGDAAVTVAASGSPAADPDGLTLIARASGGRVFPADQADALVAGLKEAFPARAVTKTVNPMRSPWWVVPFAGLLCAEWALRRKQGLP